MSVDVSKPGTLFVKDGILYETIGYWNEKVVTIEPVKLKKTCTKCGEPLPNQQESYALYSPLLQDGIETVYTQTTPKDLQEGK